MGLAVRAIHVRPLGLLLAEYRGVRRRRRCRRVRAGRVALRSQVPLEVFESLAVSYEVLISVSVCTDRGLALMLIRLSKSKLILMPRESLVEVLRLLIQRELL